MTVFVFTYFTEITDLELLGQILIVADQVCTSMLSKVLLLLIPAMLLWLCIPPPPPSPSCEDLSTGLPPGCYVLHTFAGTNLHINNVEFLF